jgi:hypothetical protein
MDQSQQDEAISPIQENIQKQTPAINRQSCRNYLAAARKQRELWA